MTRWGMVIDLDCCTACQGCVVACRAENNVPFAGPKEAELGRAIFWNVLVVSMEGEYPYPKVSYIPRPCMHCDNPSCIKVCPVQAASKGSDGIVSQIPGRCIGCRLCMCACPYSARSFNWYKPKWPSSLEQHMNPDVAVREKGVVEKCVFCVQRLRKARERARDEERELRDEDVVRLPACCQTCPAGARVFGDLDDPESTVSRLARSPRAFHLLEELGTKPKVVYLRERYGQG